jgi:hypothetical protein
VVSHIHDGGGCEVVFLPSERVYGTLRTEDDASDIVKRYKGLLFARENGLKGYFQGNQRRITCLDDTASYIYHSATNKKA